MSFVIPCSISDIKVAPAYTIWDQLESYTLFQMKVKAKCDRLSISKEVATLQ